MGASGQSSSQTSASESFSESLSEYFSKAFSQNDSYSQNTSQSGSSESRLSQVQGDIVEKREGMFNNYFFPELQSAVEETKSGSASNKAVMEQNANAINTAYNASQKSTDQTLAQQGMSSAGGVSAALKAANNRARSSSLAQAYYNQLSASQANKTNLLGMMGDQMTKPTTSAEYHNSSTSQGMSESQGTSSSESGGKSTSESASWQKSKGGGSGWSYMAK